LINRLLHHLATICPRTCGPSIHEAQIRSGATYIKVCAPGCKAPKSLKRMAQKGTFGCSTAKIGFLPGLRQNPATVH
jgi:hypothetical protein